MCARTICAFPPLLDLSADEGGNRQIIGILVQLDVTINQFEQQRNQEFILKILRKLWVTCLGELEKHLVCTSLHMSSADIARLAEGANPLH